jgi:hypothetical protein
MRSCLWDGFAALPAGFGLQVTCDQLNIEQLSGLGGNGKVAEFGSQASRLAGPVSRCWGPSTLSEPSRAIFSHDC